MSRAPAASRGAAAFPQALGGCGASLLQSTAVHGAAAIRDARDALAAVTRLQEYREYLARARAFKAAQGAAPDGAAAAFEREVLAQARQALDDLQTLSTSTIEVTRSLHRGGALDPLMASLRRALKAAGPVTVADLWAQGTTSVRARETLRRAGISDALLPALDGGIRTVEARVSVEGSRIVVAGAFGGASVTGALETGPRPAQPGRVLDLLARGRFEVVAEAAARREPAYLEGATFDTARGARTEDLALHAALSAWREGVRHVRKLEDSGLSTYEGGDPGTVGIILAIAAAVAFLTGVIVLQFCEAEDPESDACKVAAVLFVIANALMLGWAGLGLTQPPPLGATRAGAGSLLQHAVLKDLERQAP